MFYILYNQIITFDDCMLIWMLLRKFMHCWSLSDMNTTYHFLGRKQTARYFNYTNSQFISNPLHSYCS
jgi:hypothetical protein